ncbi:MAG: hypothetical protein ACK4MT_10235, partial [Thermaurantiacus tibetensis]
MPASPLAVPPHRRAAEAGLLDGQAHVVGHVDDAVVVGAVDGGVAGLAQVVDQLGVGHALAVA